MKKVIKSWASPALALNGGLVYHAIPEGPELLPFLEALSLLEKDPSPVSEAILSRLSKLDAPCFLKLFICSAMPFLS